MGKLCGKDNSNENIFKNPRVKKFCMRLPFLREILPQIEKENRSFCAKLDFETKCLLISDTYSLKNVFKHKDNIATSLSGIYEISRKLYTTILFIKIDFTPAGHHQLDLKAISVYFKTKIIIKPINRL